MPDSKTRVFGTRLGFYLAAIGSAFGLGNLWRFPYIVTENGGGAFVLLYLFLVFSLGLPLLIGELALGKIARGSLVSAFDKLLGGGDSIRPIVESNRPMSVLIRRAVKSLGSLSLLITLCVLAYYAVISGWVLHSFTQLALSLFDPKNFQPGGSLKFLLANGWLQLLLTGFHLAAVAVVVGRDWEFALEKWVGYCMPLFALLLVVLAIQALQLDSAHEALRFMFYPDFSKLTRASLGQAIGHVFFTLSVGFGSTITFASYLGQSSYLPMAAFRVCTLDTVISMFAGVMIFPLVIYGGHEFSGPQLLFQTVPHLVGDLPGGLWFGMGFFLCLYLACLGASIGLFETLVANWREARRVSRGRGSLGLAAMCFGLSVVPALSSNVLGPIKIGERGLLEFFDAALINWALPLAALLISLVVGWLLRRDLLEAEFVNLELPGSEKLFRHWLIVLRYVVPPVTLLALVLQALS